VIYVYLFLKEMSNRSKQELKTTRKAALEAGISLITLQRWITAGKIEAPRLVIVGGRATRLWSDADVERLRRYVQAHGRKAR
jgi:predicted site-specific integrase-resolvase